MQSSQNYASNTILSIVKNTSTVQSTVLLCKQSWDKWLRQGRIACLPGRSALKTWASGVSTQSMRVLATACTSRPTFLPKKLDGQESTGSQKPRSKGSKMLLRPLPPKKGVNAIEDSPTELSLGKAPRKNSLSRRAADVLLSLTTDKTDKDLKQDRRIKRVGIVDRFYSTISIAVKKFTMGV